MCTAEQHLRPVLSLCALRLKVRANDPLRHEAITSTSITGLTLIQTVSCDNEKSLISKRCSYLSNVPQSSSCKYCMPGNKTKQANAIHRIDKDTLQNKSRFCKHTTSQFVDALITSVDNVTRTNLQ
jgi:hypothetical protein